MYEQLRSYAYAMLICVRLHANAKGKEKERFASECACECVNECVYECVCECEIIIIIKMLIF